MYFPVQFWPWSQSECVASCLWVKCGAGVFSCTVLALKSVRVCSVQFVSKVWSRCIFLYSSGPEVRVCSVLFVSKVWNRCIFLYSSGPEVRVCSVLFVSKVWNRCIFLYSSGPEVSQKGRSPTMACGWLQFTKWTAVNTAVGMSTGQTVCLL